MKASWTIRLRFRPLLVALALSASMGALAQEPVARYQVELVLRLETLSVEGKPMPGQLGTEPVRTSVRGRLRMVLEQHRSPETTEGTAWRFTQVEFDPPQTGQTVIRSVCILLL